MKGQKSLLDTIDRLPLSRLGLTLVIMKVMKNGAIVAVLHYKQWYKEDNIR